MQIPEWLKTAEDGLYGSVDQLLESYTTGKEEAAWDRLVAQNAL